MQKKFLIYWWVLPFLAASALVAKIAQQAIEVVSAEGWTYHTVKNTALSTWPGSANITTLGTVTTGSLSSFNTRRTRW